MSVVLSVRELTRYYGRIRAVDRVSFEVPSGSVYGLLGPNGSGKTTTLSMIMGSVIPQSGTFQWFGNDKYIPYKKIGALVEAPRFYPYLTLEQNLMILARIKAVPPEDIRRVLEITQLWKRRLSRYFTLSLGMKQRLGIAGALLGSPEVLVLDEPANALDPEGIVDIRHIIQEEASKGKTIIMASHILDEVEKVCSQVAILKKGKIIADGPVGELLTEGDSLVVEAFETEKLFRVLEVSPLVTSVHREDDSLVLVLKKNVSPAEINQLAYSQGIILTRLEKRKKSLESQFLELVKEEEG
ncbi:MAG: ABC transporter ATP-binding protein [Bacteroidales bacterium]|nr:ABC transporter ATP-binding protein [Bacteroidales bacterium]